jgi:hypothetical protein
MTGPGILADLFSAAGVVAEHHNGAVPSAPTREYGINSRWASPDPLGPGAFSLSNLRFQESGGLHRSPDTGPQSLNRYAYVMNNPLVFIDPLGLQNDTTPCTITNPDGSQSLGFCTSFGQEPAAPQPVCYGYVDVQGAIPMYSEGACFHYWDKMAAGGLLAHFGDVSPQTLQRLARLWARRGQQPYGPAQPPQTPTQPQTQPRPAPTGAGDCVANAAAGIAKATHGAEVAFMAFLASGAHFFAAGALVTAGCADFPADLLTCGASVFGAGGASAGGLAVGGIGVFEVEHDVIPGIKQAVTCGP